jgi:hypothetical protein
MLKHIITNPGNTTLPGPVTVTAIRVPVNIRDLMFIASAAANKTANGGNNNNNMNMMMNPMQGYRNPTPFMNNPLAFLKNIQIGSSNIVNADWRLPQSVSHYGFSWNVQ